MKKIVIALCMALALAGCAGTKKVLVTEYKYQTVDVPEEFSKDCTNADLLRAYPQTPVTLGSEASLIVVDFYKVAKTCQLGAQATAEFLAKAKIIIESESDPKTIKAKLAKLAVDVREKFKRLKP